LISSSFTNRVNPLSQNNLIGKINAIILIIVIEDKIAIFMQFVMKGLIRCIMAQQS